MIRSREEFQLRMGLTHIHAAMVGNLSLLGDDGLHPSTAGYQVMSEEFMDAIVSLYEKVEGR